MKPHIFLAIYNDKSVESICVAFTDETGQRMHCWPWSRRGKNFIGHRWIGFPSDWADEGVSLSIKVTLDEYRALRRYRRQAVMARRAARRAEKAREAGDGQAPV